LNDLHQAAGGDAKYKPALFLRNEQTQALIAEIEKGTDSYLLAVEIIKGRNGGTYVCKELVYAYAMWISPKFNLAVIRAFDATVSQPQPTTPAPAIEYKPLNPQQQVGLSKAVRLRAKEAHTTTVKIYRELREVFEVASWKEIPAEKYTEAKALVKSMALEGELMPRHTFPPMPEPACHPQPSVVVPLDDWMMIADCFRTLSLAMDEAWNHQGGRSANRYNNPPPGYVQLPYQVASRSGRVMGKISQYTFAAYGLGS